MPTVKALELKNFRSFTSERFELNAPVILIEGNNGTGKTSLVEALHYACYHRSFRTSRPHELVMFDAPGFMLRIHFSQVSTCQELHIGFAGNKKLVKIDQRPVTALKDVLAHYRVITLTEDDLNLIKGGPEWRRSFIDQFISLYDAAFLAHAREYKRVLEHRNALVHHPAPSFDSYAVWSDQLWERAVAIRQTRIKALDRLASGVNELAQRWLPAIPPIQFIYEAKEIEKPSWQSLFAIECRAKRTLFGAHLDDMMVQYGAHQAREFASRGQQKLLTLLIRSAQIRELVGVQGDHGATRTDQVTLFLLDDFITDLDFERLRMLMPLLTSLGVQLIITSPFVENPVRELLSSLNTQIIKLP